MKGLPLDKCRKIGIIPTMKITLTYAEIAAMVRDRYNLPDSAQLEISGYSGIDHPAAVLLVEALTKEDCLTSTGAIRPDKKILAIKTLRDKVVGLGNNTNGALCGLCQAKYAIEDWGNFLLYVCKNGFPPMGGNDASQGWLKK
jgi:hypothetical protein